MGAQIEFVVDDDPGLPVEPPPQPRARRFGRRAQLITLVVALAAVVGWVVSRPQPAAPHRYTAGHAVPSLLNTGPPTPRLRCSTGAPLDASVVRAVDRFVTRSTIQRTLSQECIRVAGTERRKVSEALVVNAAGYNLRISLSAPRAKFPPTGYVDRANLQGRIETVAAGVRVQLLVTGYRPHAAPMARLQELADYLSLNFAL